MKQDNLSSYLILLVALVILVPFSLQSADGGDVQSGMIQIPLSANWQFRSTDCEDWLAAMVPGCVHTDLLAHGKIPDPFFGANEGALQWIEKKDWEYRTVFEADDRLLRMPRQELLFCGLDTYCDVYLNDKLILRADNMFRSWRRDCAGLLKKGQNTLRLLFHNPVAMAGTPEERFGYKLPEGHRVLTRKAAYHYGWDWGPRFVTSGVWRPVVVLGWEKARILDVRVRQPLVTEKLAHVAVECEVESAVRQRAELALQFVSPRRKRFESVCSCDLVPGSNTVRVKMTIPQPELWWSNGLGEANLYDVSARLTAGKDILDSKALKIGLRRIELVQEKDRSGTGFFFRLNGTPVFIKGANYIPQDSFTPRVGNDRYRRLLSDAADAGMNMVRVWGGGIYENGVFYDLCDQMGLLVWQDFMFANAMYPGDSEFLDNVKHEAIDNIKRLRNHPSIALWCGNNEIDEAWHNWGWKRFDNYSEDRQRKIRQDYIALFHQLLPSLVAVYDEDRSYWPSSPKFGRADPRSLTEGDAHYWGVWHDGEPFENFLIKVGRFMSEYGFQSFPVMKTIAGFAGKESMSEQSPVMLAHQKHPRGNRLIRSYMEKYYPPPKDFSSFVYLSQMMQAEGVEVALEAHRRARSYCMGTLYWQLNDCWPVASWSSIDYHGRWKALHYFVKKAFQPILVSPVVRDGFVDTIIVSDERAASDGRLHLTLWDFYGKILWKRQLDVSIPSGSSGSFFSIPEEELLRFGDRRTIVLEAVLSVEGGRTVSNLLYFALPKDLVLPEPQISWQPCNEGADFFAQVSANRLARGVYLVMEGVDGRFGDNYFDLLPGRTVRVQFFPRENKKTPDGKINIYSLVDCSERDKD